MARIASWRVSSTFQLLKEQRDFARVPKALLEKKPPPHRQQRFASIRSVSPNFSRQFLMALRRWWTEQSGQKGMAGASLLLARELWGFLRDSTPERRRRRYGDMEYDWEHRVDTTCGTVGWRERLLGVFLSAYQPTELALFQEMMASLATEFRALTFVDLGSGKGRTLLMASEYPFRRIIGVEILAELHRVAEENIRAYKSPTQRCTNIESICADASDFELPQEPLMVYLFNPVPEPGLRLVIQNLENSLRRRPRTVYVLYCNPVFERWFLGSRAFKKMGGTHQYSIYVNAE